MRKAGRLAALLAALCLLCGCARRPAVEELLRAPQLSARLAVVQKALNGYLGESAQLKYPRGGDTSSPFLFCDLNGDGVEEAVVLFRTDGRGLNVHLAVMEQSGENWALTCELEGLSGDVKSIRQSHLQTNEGSELVVVYAAADAGEEDFLAVYSYTENALAESYMRPCSGYLLADMTGSGMQDLVLACRQNGRPTLALLTDRDGVLRETQELEMDARFASCAGLHYSTRQGERYLVVDGTDQAGYTISDLFVCAGNERLKRYYFERESVMTASARLKPGLYSTDMNDDGVVEVPVVEAEIPDVNAGQLCFVSWRDFTRSSNTVVQFGVLDSENGYFLRLPAAWMGKVAVKAGPYTGSWQVRGVEDGVWYLTAVVRNKEQTAAMNEGGLRAVRMMGKNRLLVGINDDWMQDDAFVRNGIYLL